MKAVVCENGSARLVTDWPDPRRLTGETLVRVLCAGICETDLQLIRGYMGFRGVLGHEFVGIAEDGPFRGERVVGEINCSCGDCERCRTGLRNHCAHRSVLGILNHDGAFAERIAVPQANLHRVPTEISTREAVFVEPLAAAFQIPAQIPLRSNQCVIVLGDGRLGFLCAQVIALHGCRLTVVGKHPPKLALFAARNIQTQLLSDFTPDHSADVVVDCTGSPTGLPLALQAVRPRGTIVLKTTCAGEQTLSLAPIVIDEVTVVGSRCGPFERAIEALRTRQVDVLPLIDRVFSLDEAVAAVQAAQSPGTRKVLFAVGASPAELTA